MTMQEALIAVTTVANHYELTYEESVRAFERQLIVSALDNNKWNQCKTAVQLHCHRNTLKRRMEELGIARARRAGA